VSAARLASWLSSAAKRLVDEDDPVASTLELVDVAELDVEVLSVVDDELSRIDEASVDEVCWMWRW
jgi:hypothetical protein